MIGIRRLRNKLKMFQLSYFRKNIKIGKNCLIDYRTSIINNGNKIVIGKNTSIKSIPDGYHAGMPFGSSLLVDVNNAYILIGSNSRLNGVYIHAQVGIEIGYNTVIAAGVNILDSNGHVVKSKDRTLGRDTPNKIIIGNNVWIGLNAIILKGSIIGDNSVVGAGTVVRGVYPRNSLIVGNPATSSEIIY